MADNTAQNTTNSPEVVVKVKLLGDGSALVGQTRLSREEMAALRGEVGKTSKAMNDYDGAIGNAIGSVKSLAAAYLGVQAIKESILIQKEFEASLSDLSAITGAAANDLKYYQDNAKKVGADAGMMASEMVTAYKLVASGKPELMESKAALAAVSKEVVALAQAARMELPTSADALTGALNQFKAGGDEASRFINVMAAASKEGSAEIKDIAESLKSAGTEANAAGLSFEQTNTAIQLLSKIRIKGGEAGTGIRNVIGTLTSESDKLKVWGLNAKEVNPQIVGVSEALHKLQEAHLSSAAMADLFGIENKNVARQLIENANEFDNFTTKITGTSTAYEQAKIQTDNLDGDLKKLNSTYQSLQLTFGEALNPVLRSYAQDLTTILKEVNERINEARKSAPAGVNEFKSASDGSAEVYDYAVNIQQKSIAEYRRKQGMAQLELDDKDPNGVLNKYAYLETNYKALDASVNSGVSLFKNTEAKIISVAAAGGDSLTTLSDNITSAFDALKDVKSIDDVTASIGSLINVTATLSEEEKKAADRKAALNAQTTEQAKNVSELLTGLMKEAKTAGLTTEALKQLEWARVNKASDPQLDLIKNQQKIIELGKNSDVIVKKEKENALLSEGIQLTGLAYEKFRATMELQRDSVGKNSAELAKQKTQLEAQIEVNARLNAAQKANETIAELGKETKAIRSGSAGVELYTTKKSLGIGATDAEAQAVVTGQLAKSIAEKNLAVKQEYELSLLTEPLRAVEIKRRELGATATTEQAKGLVELNKITKANNDLQAAQTAVDISGLSKNAQEYLRLMKETNKETGTQIALLNARAAAQGAGTERLASLREEVMLLQMSTKDQAAYNALKDVAPEQRGGIKALVDQRTELERVRKSWEATTDKVVDYFQKIATGEMGFKAAFKDLAVELNRDKIKETLDKFKEMLKGESSTVKLDGALNFNDAKTRQDVTAATQVFDKYQTSLMTGTDSSVKVLIAGIDSSIDKLTKSIDASITKMSNSVPKVAANDVSYNKINSDTLGSLSAKYESGKRGAATVSTGAGDHGGVSYGTYQLSSKMGTADDFVKSIKDTIFGQTLAGLKAGTAEFSAKWQDLAARDSTTFGKIQHDYIKRTLYDPLVESADEMGVDLKKRSKALNDVVWSTGVQHGGKTSIVDSAITKVGANASDAELIKAIYELRSDVKVTFKSSSESVQQAQIIRFNNESKEALAQLAAEAKNASTAVSGHGVELGKNAKSLSESTGTIGQHVGALSTDAKSLITHGLNIDNLTSREGLRVKGGINGQAFAGGGNAAGLTALAQLIQKAEGGLLTRFTAFNDKYHSKTDSMHAKGLALDFTVKDASQSAEAAKIVTDLGKSLGVALKVIDEYKAPSARSTGGHIHVNFKSKADADKLLSEVTGRVGQSINLHADALERNKDSVESAKSSTDSLATNVAKSATVIDLHSGTVINDAQALNNHAVQASQSPTQGGWGYSENTKKTKTLNTADPSTNVAQYAKGSLGALFSTGGKMDEIGKVFSSGGALEGIGSTISSINSSLGGKLAGLDASGVGSMAMSALSGDLKGAAISAIGMGLDAAMPGVGTAFNLIAAPVMGRLFGEWKVEAQHLTANIHDLGGTFQQKTIEVNKGLIGGGKKTSYSAVTDEQNKELQAALKSVTTQIESVGKQIGKSLTDNFKFDYVIDMVHADTGTFEKQFARAQAVMVKNAFTSANLAGVDTSITDVMGDKVQNLLKSASDGVYDKALQSFMWKPDTAKYGVEINGTIKNGLDSLIAGTDWSGLDVEKSTAKLQTYLTDAFGKAGVDVPQDTFQHMAEQLSGQIQDGLKFLETSKNTVNPDAPFFKNMRAIVDNFNEWNAKPEEVSGFITSVLNLKDAFKAAQIGTQNITQSLLDMAGGSDKIGALTANVNAYSAAFLDDASKNSTKIASLTTDVSSAFAVFGVQMPKTKTDFVALTNSIDMTTDSGKKAFVALMDIAPKYAELAQLQATAGVGLDMFSAKLAELPKISSNVASAMTNSLNSSVQNKVGAAQAGKDLGKTMAGEIQKSLAGMVTDTISNMVVKGLVTPMLQAGVQNANMTLQAGAMSAQNLAIGGSNAAANLTMGGNNAAQGMTAGSNNAATGLSAGGSTAAAALAAGGQIAADYISGLTTQIITTIEIMGKVMADPALKKAMETVTSATEKVGESAYTMMTDTNSYLAQDFSISAASSQSAANSSGGGGTDTAANDAKTLADSLKKLHESLTDLETGLTGNELTLNKLSRAYGNVDLSMVNLSGNSTDVAKSLNSLSDTQLQSIATAAGKTIDELSSDMQSYVNILRDQTKALTDFRNGLDKYTSAGENNTARTKDLTREMMLMGVSAEQAVGYIKTLSDADLSAKAKTLNMTSEELRGTVIPAVLQGMMDFETGLKDLKNNTLSTYTVGRKTDSTSQWVEQLSTEAAKLGLTAKTAAAWIETLKPEELEAYATKMGVTRDQLIKDVIPQTLTSINSVGEAFRNLGLDMQALTDKSFTPAQRTIAQLAETYPTLNIAQLAHSTTSEQLAKYYQSLSKEQIVEFAASIHKLPEDVIKDGLSLVNAMRDNENAAKSVADSWIENFKRVTDSIDSLSTSIKGDIGTVTGKKGLSDSITAAKTSTDYTYNQQIADINTTYDAAPQTAKTAAMLDKVAATEQAYTDSVSTFSSQRATIIANFTSQYAQQNDALRAKIFAPYQGTKANILQDPDELSKRVASANELRQALTSQFSEQKKAIEDKYKLESDNAAKLLDAAKQIGNTIRDLRLDSTLSTLTKKQQLGESRAAFNELASKAINNNDAAAAAEAQSMAKTLLGKGRDYSASGKDYTDLFGDVTSKLGNIKTKFGDVSTSDKTKPFEQTAYASELKQLQLSTVAQLKEIDTAGQWVKEHGTEELATGLINLGSQFGLDIGQVTDTLKLNFPALGDKLQNVINAIDKISTKGTVSDAQINEYVQGAIKRAGGVNANSVKDITDTAKYFDVSPDRMASALGTDATTVSKTAAAYGQSYNNISDKQITSFVQDATAKYGTGTEEGVTAIYNAAKDNGVTSGQLANAIGWTDQDVLDMAQKYNLPAFAEGGFVDKPTIALVGEAGPEYIVPASKLQTQQPGGGQDNSETNELLRRLIAAHQETQRILQLLLQAEQQSGQKIVGELQQQPRETARLIGQKIDALNGK